MVDAMDGMFNSTSQNVSTKPTVNFKIVITFGLIMVILNGLCTMYVLGRTLSRWFITKKSLPMALRVPFYIASTGNYGAKWRIYHFV